MTSGIRSRPDLRELFTCSGAVTLLFLIIAATAPQAARGQDAGNRTLRQIVDFGLAHNHDLRSVQFSAAEAHAANAEARGALLPAVRGEGNYVHLSPNIPDFDLTLPAEFGGGNFSVPAIRDRYDVSVRIEQPLLFGTSLLPQKKASSLNALARDEDLNAAEASIAYSIRGAYWQLYQAQAALDVVRASVSSVEQHLANTLQRREAGAALASDVLALQARLGEVKLEALEAENNVKLARLQLADVAGLPLDEEVVATEQEPVDWATLDSDLLEQLALSESPVLRAASLDQEAATAMTRAAQSEWFPQIFAIGLYQYARPNQYIFPQEDVFTGTWQVGVSARWDLWNWGQTRARAQQARARADRANERVAADTRSVRLAVRKSVLNLEHSRLAVSVAHQNVAHAESSFAMVERRFNLGGALTSEVLDAEVTSRTAKLKEAQAVAAYGIARATLLKELGFVYASEFGTMQ